MSLLNDALRKKRMDEQPTDISLKSALPKQGNATKRNRKLQWSVVACVLVIAAATCGGWLYWAESDASSDLGVVPSSSNVSDTHNSDPRNIDSEEKPAIGNSIASPNAIASIASETAAVPVKPDIPVVKTNGRPIKDNDEQVLVSTPARIKPEAPAKTHADVRPEKKIAKVIPRKRPTPKKPAAVSRPKSSMSRSASNGTQGDSLYRKARQYHRQGRIKKAVSLYQEVIKVDPEHYKARFNLSAAFLELEAYTQAFPIIAELYDRQPHNLQVMLNLAIAHVGCGRYSQALDLLDKAGTQSSAPVFEVAFHKGVAYSHMNQAQTALDWYKRAEVLKPEDPRLLFNLAVVSDQQQQYGAAVDYYSRYLDHNPGIDALKEKQIRRRIRTLLTYYSESTVKE